MSGSLMSAYVRATALPMTFQGIVSHFGTAVAAARGLDISRATLYRWRDNFPVNAQLEVQRKTKGALKADLSAYETEKA